MATPQTSPSYHVRSIAGNILGGAGKRDFSFLLQILANPSATRAGIARPYGNHGQSNGHNIMPFQPVYFLTSVDIKATLALI